MPIHGFSFRASLAENLLFETAVLIILLITILRHIRYYSPVQGDNNITRLLGEVWRRWPLVYSLLIWQRMPKTTVLLAYLIIR